MSERMLAKFAWWWVRVLAGATSVVCAFSTVGTVTEKLGAPEWGWVAFPLGLFVLLPLWGPER